MSSKAQRSLPSGERSVVNLSGWKATHFKALVLPDKVEDTIKMKGPNGEVVEFKKPTEHVDKMQAAAVTGIIVHISPLGFRYEIWPEGSSPPKVGDRVAYAKYAGQKIPGKDGQDYIFLNDTDICGVQDF